MEINHPSPVLDIEEPKGPWGGVARIYGVLWTQRPSASLLQQVCLGQNRKMRQFPHKKIKREFPQPKNKTVFRLIPHFLTPLIHGAIGRLSASCFPIKNNTLVLFIIIFLFKWSSSIIKVSCSNPSPKPRAGACWALPRRDNGISVKQSSP